MLKSKVTYFLSNVPFFDCSLHSCWDEQLLDDQKLLVNILAVYRSWERVSILVLKLKTNVVLKLFENIFNLIYLFVALFKIH